MGKPLQVEVAREVVVHILSQVHLPRFHEVEEHALQFRHHLDERQYHLLDLRLHEPLRRTVARVEESLQRAEHPRYRGVVGQHYVGRLRTVGLHVIAAQCILVHRLLQHRCLQLQKQPLERLAVLRRVFNLVRPVVFADEVCLSALQVPATAAAQHSPDDGERR